MSIFSSIAAFAAPIVGGIFGGPAGAAIGTAIGGAIAPAPQQPRARADPRLQQAVMPGAGALRLPERRTMAPLPALSRVPQFGQGAVRAPTRELAFSGGACPVGFHLDKRTRSFCVRNRRMNPLNGKAASRAIRRIKGARKMLQKIERNLPKARSAARRPTRHLTGPAHT